MRVQDQVVTFKVFKEIKLPTAKEECFKVEQVLKSDTLERALLGNSYIEDEKGAEQLQLLNTSLWKRRVETPFESLGLAELKNSKERLKSPIEEAPALEPKPPDTPPAEGGDAGY